MAVDTYDNLKAEIVTALARSDISATDGQVDSYIDLLEAEVNLRVRHRRMLKTATIASSGNVVTLPTDFLEIYTFANTSNPKSMVYTPQSGYQDFVLNQGLPYNFSLDVNSSGADVVNVDSNGTYVVKYYAKIPALTSILQTNWLLNLYPDVYYSGALYYGFRKLRNALAADYKGLMDEAIDKLTTHSERVTGGGGGMRAQVSGTIV